MTKQPDQNEGGPQGDVAQLVEHLLCKQRVWGSNPHISTNESLRQRQA